MKLRDVIAIDIESGTFSKVYHEGYSTMKSKITQLSVIDNDSNGVSIPSVAKYLDEERTIVFDFLFGIKPLKSYLFSDRIYLLARRIGRGLSVYHDNLNLGKEHRILLPEPFNAWQGKQAYLHLDFNLVNIQYDIKADLLYFVDWEISPLIGGRSTYGSIYYDIIYFVYQLFNSRPLVFTSYHHKKAIADNFLYGYTGGSSSLDYSKMKEFSIVYTSIFRPFEEYTLWKHHIKYFNYKNFYKYIDSLSMKRDSH